MNADAITAKIMVEARGVAAQLLREANERAEQIRHGAEAELAKQREQTMDQARRECADLRDRMLRMAELEERKQRLSAKRSVINQAFDRAAERMRAMPDEQRCAYMHKLLVSNAEGDELIVVSDSDAKLFDSGFLTSVNKAMAESGKASNLLLSTEHRETGGGFILKRGGMEVNCTFPAMLEEKRVSLEAEVAGLLFD